MDGREPIIHQKDMVLGQNISKWVLPKIFGGTNELHSIW